MVSTAPAFLRLALIARERRRGKRTDRKGTGIAFSGPVVIDEDGPFLEVHPDEGLRVVSGGER